MQTLKKIQILLLLLNLMTIVQCQSCSMISIYNNRLEVSCSIFSSPPGTGLESQPDVQSAMGKCTGNSTSPSYSCIIATCNIQNIHDQVQKYNPKLHCNFQNFANNEVVLADCSPNDIGNAICNNNILGSILTTSDNFSVTSSTLNSSSTSNNSPAETFSTINTNSSTLFTVTVTSEYAGTPTSDSYLTFSVNTVGIKSINMLIALLIPMFITLL